MNILEELWYGNIYPNEQAIKQNSEYAQALHKVVDEKESLLPSLAPELKKAIERLMDVQMEAAVITVRRQVARVNGEITEAPLKTKNSYRRVNISPQAIEVLKQQKSKTNSEYVFPSPTGGPISPDSVNNMLKRVLSRAGIPKVRFHDLRHTFATIALQNGVDIKTVSGILGHFSAGFTLDTYAHVTTAAQKEAAITMGNVLSM